MPGAFSTVTPCLAASPERGRTCPSLPAGRAMAMPVGISARAPGASATGASAGDRRQQVEPGGVRALIARQRQVGAVRQAQDAQFELAHGVCVQRVGDARDERARDLVLGLRRPGLDAVGA